MRMTFFAVRTAKEIIRDPLTVFFGLGFPAVIMLLMTAIQSNIPVSLFEIASLAPGIAVFGLSFITLFSAMLISKDRTGAFLQRLFTSPLTAADYIAGYTLPMLPIALAQSAVCYLLAVILGLPVNINLLLAVVVIIPAALFFIGLGLFCGSVLNDKQVGGVCGALITNITAFLSGIWFDPELVGGVFEAIAKALPFYHAAAAERAAISGDMGEMLPHILIVSVYALVTFAAASAVFTHKMRNV